LVNAYPEHGRDGQIEQVVVTFINITKIKETEEKLQIIANNTYNWEFWENPEEEFVYHSPACREITGHGPDELIQNIDLFLDMIHPEDKQGYLDQHKDARSLLKKRSHNFRIIAADGQTRHIEQLCQPVFDDQNNFLGVRGTNVDITERIEAREKLIESELFANAIVESTPALLYIYDLEKGENVWVNEYHKLFFEGISLESSQFKKDDITQLTHPDDFEKLQSMVMLLDNSPDMDKTETEIRIMYKGAWKWFSALISVFKTNEQGKPAQILGALIDIDDRKQVEEELNVAKVKAEEASQLKTAFIDNISHEIRTPLNGIVGFGQLIAQTNITREERLSYFNVLQQSTDRLIQTVTDFMDISKITSGNMKVNKSEFFPKAILEEQLDTVNALCAKKDIRVELVMPDGHGSLKINSDHELLRKVLGHLLGNAAKFSDKGSISFGFQTKEHFLEFFVKDQGKGITKDKLENIFEAFEQEETAMTRGYEGSGLGLAIAKGITQLLGGKIWAKSAKGTGSEFFFTIPYDDRNQKDAAVILATPSVKAVKNPLILVAEDDESNMAYTTILLKKAGFRTLQAKNGKEAVNYCKSNTDISLVLMDIKMPVINGLEATKMIKASRKDLPVIALTAYIKAGDKHLVREAGCDDYCLKPFSREDILSLIGRYVVKPEE
jgi:PAS domain S-box-containing protein